MDVLSLRDYPLGGVDPRGRPAVWRRNTIYPQATKMTQDLDAGELPGELTPVHRDAAL